MKKISIALATYNGARYLREQLDSILRQSVPFSELVISDDASTDDTWRIITEYAAKDARINAYRNETNIGFIANFEKALSHCTGDYIALSDQDDIWLPEHIEVLLNHIGDKILAVGDAEVICADGYRTGKRLSYLEHLDCIPESDVSTAYTIFFYRGCMQGASMLFKRALLSKGLPIPGNGIYHDVWLSALACFAGGMRYISEVVTLYRRHDKAVTGAKKRRNRLRTIIGHILLNRTLRDRNILVQELRTRLRDVLNDEQTAFLNQAEKYYARRNTLLGRIRNFFFEIRYYKMIYSCNGLFGTAPKPTQLRGGVNWLINNELRGFLSEEWVINLNSSAA